MFCQNCGTKLAEGSKFCPDCGTKIGMPTNISKETTISSDKTENKTGKVEGDITEKSSGKEEIDIGQVNEFYTKCKKCGEDFTIAREKVQEDGVYECPKCHEPVEITFFHYCSNCKKPVGFWEFSWSDALSGIGKAVLKGVFDHSSVAGVWGRITDKIPTALAAGDCPFYDNYYLECPKCKSSVLFPIEDDSKSVVECEKCGTKMRRPLNEVNKIAKSAPFKNGISFPKLKDKK
jgi:predicted nucleic acid-binding Zn ribbon protein